MKKFDNKGKPGANGFLVKIEQHIDRRQKPSSNKLTPIYNEDTKSLPIALKRKIAVALSDVTDEKNIDIFINRVKL